MFVCKDYVIPANEFNSLFIMTSFTETEQVFKI